jgi:hypothetical protein
MLTNLVVFFKRFMFRDHHQLSLAEITSMLDENQPFENSIVRIGRKGKLSTFSVVAGILKGLLLKDYAGLDIRVHETMKRSDHPKEEILKRIEPRVEVTKEITELFSINDNLILFKMRLGSSCYRPDVEYPPFYGVYFIKEKVAAVMFHCQILRVAIINGDYYFISYYHSESCKDGLLINKLMGLDFDKWLNRNSYFCTS